MPPKNVFFSLIILFLLSSNAILFYLFINKSVERFHLFNPIDTSPLLNNNYNNNNNNNYNDNNVFLSSQNRTLNEYQQMYEYSDPNLIEKPSIHLMSTCDQLPAEKNSAEKKTLCEIIRFMSDGTPKRKQYGWVIAQMATSTRRMDTTVESVTSLRGQVDKLLIYFNDGPDNNTCSCNYALDTTPYTEGTLPIIFSEPWIFLIRSSSGKYMGNIGDRGKFYFSNLGPPSYRFIVDDDIRYPSNYVDRVLEAMYRFENKVVVSVHCSWLKRNAATIWDHVDLGVHKHFTYARPKGEFPDFVNYSGTGAMTYHTSILSLSISDFALPNMADLFFSILCQKQHLPIFCMDRDSLWLSQARDTKLGVNDLWVHILKNDNALQSLSSFLIRSNIPWKVFRPILNGRPVPEGLF